MAAVDTAHPAIEFPDSRLEAFERAGEAALMPRQGVGEPGEREARVVEGVAAAALIGRPPLGAEGRAPYEGRGGNALDDPRLALTWLANALSGQRWAQALSAISAASPARSNASRRESGNSIAGWAVSTPYEGRGGNALDDPRLALTWLANALSGQGLSLRRGDVRC
jgi:2-keto-4-pentenoate hydratase